MCIALISQYAFLNAAGFPLTTTVQILMSAMSIYQQHAGDTPTVNAARARTPGGWVRVSGPVALRNQRIQSVDQPASPPSRRRSVLPADTHAKRQVEDQIMRIEVVRVAAFRAKLEHRSRLAPQRGRNELREPEEVARWRVADLPGHVRLERAADAVRREPTADHGALLGGGDADQREHVERGRVAQPATREEISAEIAAQFDEVTEADARSDVDAALRQMVERGLITRV